MSSCNNTLYVIIPFFNFGKNQASIRIKNLKNCIKNLYLQLATQNDLDFKIIIGEAYLDYLPKDNRINFKEILFELQPFKNARKHLELVSYKIKHPLWIKENIINVVVKNNLPSDWKYFVWLDADVQFINPDWSRELLTSFNEKNIDIIQMFQHLCYLDSENNIYAEDTYDFLQIGVVYLFSEENTRTDSKRGNLLKAGPHWGAPGMAWAIRRSLYDRIGGLFELAIVGEGDFLQVRALFPKFIKIFNEKVAALDHKKPYSAGYRDCVYTFAKKLSNANVGYLTGNIVHYYHGPLSNRYYDTRLEILHKHSYDPRIHLVRDKNNILSLHPNCKDFVADVEQYFENRDN
jgi:hypothetical protein